MEDYLLSNTQRYELAAAAMENMRKKVAQQRNVSLEEVDMSRVQGLFFVHSSYLSAAHDEIKKHYGNMENFLHRGVNCSASDLRRFRDELLE